MFSMKPEYSTEWHKFLHQIPESEEQVLGFTMGKERFLFYPKDKNIAVKKLDGFAKYN
jgi:hypothetical protein